MLPKLPNIDPKTQVGVDKVLLYLEPFMPKTQFPKAIKPTRAQIDKFHEDYALEMQQRRLQVSSLRRAVVLSVPVDIDITKFPYKVHDIVSVPNQTNDYDVVNIDKHPLYLVGTRDIRLILPELTEEEATNWDDTQKRYLEEVVYFVEDNTMPAPTGRVIPIGDN